MQGIGGKTAAWLGVTAGVKSAVTTAPTYDSTNKCFKIETASLPAGADGMAVASPYVLYSNDVLYKDCENTVSLS
jgi:hypothetical protein